jgi:hypothetical protein
MQCKIMRKQPRTVKTINKKSGMIKRVRFLSSYKNPLLFIFSFKTIGTVT